MSTYLTAHIEYKKDGKWHLLKLYGPHIKHTHSQYQDGAWVDKTNDPDVVLSDNSGLDSHDEFSYQSIIRDFFNPSSLDNAENLTDKGFPNDMSDELKQKFDNITESRLYNKTYCTLSELETAVEKKFDQFRFNLNQQTAAQYNKNTNAKLDKIISILDEHSQEIRASSNSFPHEDTDCQTSIEYLWQEEFTDIIILKQFVNYIASLAEDFVEVYNNDRVRLIMYFG